MVSPNGDKNLKNQIQSLRSSNRSAILNTIQELRSKGDVSVLPELFNLMLVREDQEILDGIASLLNDLKDKGASEILAEAIANPEYEEIQTPLVSACWQNGLSYTKYINTFVEVIITGEYSAAIEAFTVIEGAIGELENEDRLQLARSLKLRLREVDEQKKPLMAELVRHIETY